MTKLTKTTLTAAALSLLTAPLLADTINGNLTVRERLCAGFECANGGTETFGAEDLKLKSTAPWLKFEDVPGFGTGTNDWQLRINGGNNDPSNFFAIEDLDASTLPFRVDAGAPTDALRVLPNGNVGVGTSTPSSALTIRRTIPTLGLVGTTSNNPGFLLSSLSTQFVIQETNGSTNFPFRLERGAPNAALRVAANGDLTMSTGNLGVGTSFPTRGLHVRKPFNPTLRFEQDGSTGAPPQIWDLQSSNAGFILSDITANTSPIIVRPGAGNNRAMVVTATGDIGLGTVTPEAKLHVAGTSMLIKNNGRVNFTLSDTSNPGPDFRTQLTAGTARFSFVGTGAPEMELFQTGDLSIRGRYISAGTQLTVPDYVFDDDYALRPLAEVQSFIDTHSHLPDVPSAADIAEDGLDLTEMQMTLLKKIEELTLYTLEQEAKNQAQEAQLKALNAEIAALKAAQN